MKNTSGVTRHLDVRTGDKFRTANQRGSLVNATVVNVFFDQVAIQLSGGGAILHGLRLIGGPVKAGDSVQVDFTTNPPLVIAKGNAYLSADDLEAALKKLNAGLTGGKTRFDIMLFSGGGVSEIYSPTIEGLVAAVAAAGSGDLVVLPDIDITTDLTLSQGVALSGLSSRQSIIRGTITLSQDCTLENLCVINAQEADTEVNAVIAQGVGFPSWIKGCEIHAYNCGSGLANAIKIQSDTELLQVTDSVVVGDSKLNANAHAFSGEAGVSGEAGTCKIFNCRLYSKSATHYDGNAFYEYSNIGTVTELERACILPEDTNIFSSKWQVDHGENLYSVRAQSVPVTPVATQFETDNDPGVGSVVRWGDYLYYRKPVNTTDVDMVEYQISTATKTYVKACDSTYVLTPTRVVVEERKLLVLGPSVGGSTKLAFYLLDFSFEVSELYHEFETEFIDTATIQELAAAPAFESVRLKNGDLMVVAWGTYDRTDLDLSETSRGVYWYVKNWTQDGPWQLIKRLSLPSYVDAPIFEAFSTIVDNKYFCVIAEVDPGNAYTTNVVPFHVLNLETLDDDSVEYELPSYYSASVWVRWENMGADNENLLAFASGKYANGSNENYWTFSFNPVTLDITLTGIASSGHLYSLTSKTNYYHILSNGDGTLDLIRTHDEQVMWDNFSYPVGGFTPNVMVAKSVDDNGRIWFYERSDNTIKGILLTDQDDILSFASQITVTTTVQMRLLNDYFYVRRASDKFIFLIGET